MSDFEKLFKKLLVHEAFDKSYPIKNSYGRSKEEIEKEIEANSDQAEQERRRKQYALRRMDPDQRYSLLRSIDRRREETEESLQDEIRDNERRKETEQDLNNTFKNYSSELTDIKNQIIELALNRQGSPRKDYIELVSIQNILKNFIDAWLIKTGKKSGYQTIRGVVQDFESKSGLMMISLSMRFAFDEYTKDLEKGNSSNGIIDISFRPKKGNYSDVTGGGDASQLIATVMEFSFAAFSIIEASLKVLFPDFYEWKKTSRINPNATKVVIKFSGVSNTGAINTKSKTVRQGLNKRNRLYSLGWDRAMRKRATDLELLDTNFGTIYIQYKR